MPDFRQPGELMPVPGDLIGGSCLLETTVLLDQIPLDHVLHRATVEHGGGRIQVLVFRMLRFTV
jgi:hypothetical protein